MGYVELLDKTFPCYVIWLECEMFDQFGKKIQIFIFPHKGQPVLKTRNKLRVHMSITLEVESEREESKRQYDHGINTLVDI